MLSQNFDQVARRFRGKRPTKVIASSCVCVLVTEGRHARRNADQLDSGALAYHKNSKNIMNFQTAIHSFRTSDNERLHGALLTPADNKSDIALILVHGVAMNF